MKIGVTGSRWGLTGEAERTARGLLYWLTDTDELHHGDCVGVDFELATIAEEFGMRTVAHPPLSQRYRGFHKSTVVLPEHGYLQRNRNIVDTVDRMIACPHTRTFEPRSGTWATINYTKRAGKPLAIVHADGELEIIR